jgi:hypothetical protein
VIVELDPYAILYFQSHFILMILFLFLFSVASVIAGDLPRPKIAEAMIAMMCETAGNDLMAAGFRIPFVYV